MQRIRLLRIVRLGVKNLLLHKLRSILTMLGIVFGVASVIAMLSIGEGASKQALDEIRKLGSTNIIIESQKAVEDDARVSTYTAMGMYGILYEDEQRIRETMPNVRQTAPIKVVRKEGRLNERSLELRVVGTNPSWFDLVQRPMMAGRPILPRDIQNHANSVVLTEFGARKLLATEAAIGEQLRLGGDFFEVVGIVRSDSSQGGSLQTPDQEVDAYIPLNVARERFGDVMARFTAGARTIERVELHALILQADSEEHVEPLAEGVTAMFKRFHKKEDYKINVPLALLRQAEKTRRTYNVVLGSIAGISLLVGGIGIMNIMLASVTERTREIGVRRAIGAKRRHIVIQFLIETMVLSTAGGLLGIVIGIAIPWVVTVFAGMPTVISMYSLVLSAGISVAVGIIFGLYPAARASRLDPIEALRHE